MNSAFVLHRRNEKKITSDIADYDFVCFDAQFFSISSLEKKSLHCLWKKNSQNFFWRLLCFWDSLFWNFCVLLLFHFSYFKHLGRIMYKSIYLWLLKKICRQKMNCKKKYWAGPRIFLQFTISLQFTFSHNWHVHNSAHYMY